MKSELEKQDVHVFKDRDCSPLLFYLVMDVLHLMIERAASDGLLSALSEGGLRHRTSMYADDVVTFVRPT
jgi:hypothetical protein